MGSSTKTSASSSPLRRLGQMMRWAAFGDLRRRATSPGSSPAPSPSRPAGQSPEDDDRRLCTALGIVLDTDKRSRRVFPHLAAIEQTLRKQGVAGLQDVSPQVIGKALLQLESVVMDWTIPGLSALQRLLSVRLIAAEQAKANAETHPASEVHPSSFHAMSRLQVCDASESEFLRAAGRL